MLKKTLFVLGALLASSPLASAITVVGPYSGSRTVYIGSEFSVDFLFYSDTAQISSFDMAVQYPSFLSYVGATEDGFFATNGVLGLSPDSTDNPPVYVVIPPIFPSTTPTVIDQPGYITQLYDAAVTADTDPVPSALFTLTFVPFRTGSGSIAPVCDGPNDCTSYPMLADVNSNPVSVDGLNSLTLNAVDGPPPAPVPEPALGIPCAGAFLFLLWRRRKLTGSSPA